MDITNMVIIGAIATVGIGSAVAWYYYKRRNLVALFDHVHETSKQIPKQKKNSFRLFMFKEALSASKKKSKSTTGAGKLNNPKYIEIQMMQMSQILKDRSKVQDKTIKKSLLLLDDYLAWEEKKNAKAKQSAQEKVA